MKRIALMTNDKIIQGSFIFKFHGYNYIQQTYKDYDENIEYQ